MLEEYIIRLDADGVQLSQGILKKFNIKSGDNIRVRNEGDAIVLIP
jgi:hypothetical protein